MANNMSSDTAIPLQSIQVTLIRHGQSVDNINGIWAGHKDSPLTSTGLAQAKALAESFANVHLDAVYSSDLKRASQTAHEIVNQNKTSPPPPLVQTQSLREQFFGAAEGQDVSQAEKSNPSNAETARDAAFPSGETLNAVNARLATAVRRFILPRLEGLRNNTASQSFVPHVCIVAHGIAIAELLRVFMAAHDSASQYGEPWQHPQLAYQRTRLANTGWTRLQLSVPGANAVPRREPDQAADEQLNRPPRRDVFVRFVGQQNNTAHMQQLGTLSSSSMSGALAGGPTDRSSSRPTSGTHTPTAGEEIQQERSSFNAYSAKNMSRAIGGGGSGGGSAGSRRDTSSRDGPLSKALSAYYKSGSPTQFDTNQSGNLLGLLSAYNTNTDTGSVPTLSSPPSVPTSVNNISASAATIQPRPFVQVPFPTTTSYQATGSNSDLWKLILSKTLPIFQTRAQKPSLNMINVEEINELLSQHIKNTLDRGPARACNLLIIDLRNCLINGLSLMESKILHHSPNGITDDSNLLMKLTTFWTLFFHSILPLVEACFLPLGTDPILLSLASATSSTAAAAAAAGGSSSSSAGAASTSSVHHSAVASPPTPSTSHLQLPSAVTGSNNGGPSPFTTPNPSTPSNSTTPNLGTTSSTASGFTTPIPGNSSAGGTSMLRSQRIHVRQIALSMFRDTILLPHFDRLFDLFSRISRIQLGPGALGKTGGNAGLASSNSELGLGLGLGLSVGGGAVPSTASTVGPSASISTSILRGGVNNAGSLDEDSHPMSSMNSSTTMTPSMIHHRLTQMNHLLRSVQSGDDSQRAMEALLRALRVGLSNIPDNHTDDIKLKQDIGIVPPPSSSTSLSSTQFPKMGTIPPLEPNISSSSVSSSLSSSSSLNPITSIPSTTLPTTDTMSSSNHHRFLNQGNRVVNRRGWIPRSAAKHGIHAVHQQKQKGAEAHTRQAKSDDLTNAAPALPVQKENSGSMSQTRSDHTIDAQPPTPTQSQISNYDDIISGTALEEGADVNVQR
ncbi:unnamed protein product [Sympodiomycopsis kandeliae]